MTQEADWREWLIIAAGNDIKPSRLMQRLSKKALKLGEDLLDHVRYGLTRYDAIKELAEMADESNSDLLEAVSAVLRDAQRNGGVPAAFQVAHLQRVFADYEPIPRSSDLQRELSGLSVPAQEHLL